MFSHRSKMMIYTKMNFSHDPKYEKELWVCEGCKVSISTQSHVLWCPSYLSLRENKNITNDKDLAQYLQAVFKGARTFDQKHFIRKQFLRKVNLYLKMPITLKKLF